MVRIDLGAKATVRAPVELRCYFVSQCEFEHPDADETEGDLRLVSAKQFLDKVRFYTFSFA